MTLQRMAYTGSTILLVLLAIVFLGNQRLAQAEEIEVHDPGLPSECSDLIDNDGDGLIDFVPVFGDPDCEDIFDTSESGSAGGGSGGGENPPLNQCMDGVDNDNDGLVDLDDPGCTNVGDNDESDDSPGGGGEELPACSDGIDNDEDSLVDDADPGCTDANDADETDPADDGGGNGGGGTPACDDSIDNDNDGLVDANDPGCSDPTDNDETDPTPSSGGGGSSGGGAYLEDTSAYENEGEVLGTTTPEVIEPEPAEMCEQYISVFIRPGAQNDTEQVLRMQSVLNKFEGANVEENGEYDAASISAVRAFQLKYAADILSPWGITQPTGFVYLTTRKKLNEVRCENAETFPLTEEQREEIAQSRNVAAVAVTQVALPIPTPEMSDVPEQPQEENASGESEMMEDAMASTEDEGEEEPAVTLPGNRLGDFFRRLFDRFR